MGASLLTSFQSWQWGHMAFSTVQLQTKMHILFCGKDMSI